MKNINKIQIVPDEVYEIGADKTPVIPEWSVKDDETLWQKVNKLVHSTYAGDQPEGSTPGYLPDGVTPLDTKKFTYSTEHRPTITDDGIASGFSSSNYLRANFSALSDNYEIILPIKWASTSANVEKLYSLRSTYTQLGIFTKEANNGVYFKLYESLNNAIINNNTTGNPIVSSSDIVNKQYFAKFKCVKNENSYTYTVSVSDDLKNWTEKISIDSEYSVSFNNMIIGTSISDGTPATNAVADLKYISATAYGVPVFSGNETGIDTIKPVDYTAPTDRTLPNVTDDGIASGFANNKMIQLSNSAIGSSYSTFDIYWKQKFTTLSGAQSILTTQTGSADSLPQVGGVGLIIYTWGAGKPTIRLSSDGTNNDIANDVESDIAMVVNTDYYFRFSFDGSSYKLYGSTDGKNYNVWKTIPSSTKMYGLYDFILGGMWAPQYAVYDLNAFKVYVDGNLVYQPCLKIPYTEAKGNKKVVDKKCRDRVKDLFEQEGYNIYYTLGEDDFTLPSNKPNDIVKYKANGLTVAEQRADQTLTIRGACESGVDVNLPMDFFDGSSYAVFGVGTTGTNTASKFTPAADGNYIAIGKGKVA